MKLFMILVMVVVSGLVTVAVCPTLRHTAKDALVNAELLPQDPASQEEASLPASGAVAEQTTTHDAEVQVAKTADAGEGVGKLAVARETKERTQAN